MNHDTAAERSVRGTTCTNSSTSSGSGSEGVVAENDCSGAAIEGRDDMKEQSAPSTTVSGGALHNEGLRDAPFAGASTHAIAEEGSQVSIALIGPDDVGGEDAASSQTGAPPPEHLIFPSQQLGTCPASGDDRSQSEATTGSVTLPRAAHCPFVRTPAARSDSTASSPAIAGEAAASEAPRVVPPSAYPGTAIEHTAPLSSFSGGIPLGQGKDPAGAGTGSVGALASAMSPEAAGGVDVDRVEADGDMDHLDGGGEKSSTPEEPACGGGRDDGPVALSPAHEGREQQNEQQENKQQDGKRLDHQQREHERLGKPGTDATGLSLKEDTRDVKNYTSTGRHYPAPAMKADGGVLAAPPSPSAPLSPPYSRQVHGVQHGAQQQSFVSHGPDDCAQKNNGRFVDNAHHGGQFQNVQQQQQQQQQQEHSFGNHGFPLPLAAAMLPHLGYSPMQAPAGPPQLHGTMADAGDVALSNQSYSGLSLPNTGRAPLFPTPPGQGGDGSKLVLMHPAANFDQHQQQRKIYQLQHMVQSEHQHHREQQQNLPGIVEAPDPYSHGIATPVPPGPATAHGLPDPASAPLAPLEPPQANCQNPPSSVPAANYAPVSSLTAATGASQASGENGDVAAPPRVGSGSGSSTTGGPRGGMSQPARGTVAGVVAAVAAAGRRGADGEATQNNAYNDIGLVVTRTKELEKIMRDLFGATGNGLNELLSSLRTERRIDPRTQQRIRSIAAMRNKLVHSVDANNLTISNTFGASARKAFKAMCDDLEVNLRDCVTTAVEEPFEQGPRPADAFRLGNHPAFRGIGRVGGRDDDSYNEAAGLAEAEAEEAAFAARRDQEALVVRDSARFPHNLITAKRKKRGDEGLRTLPAPDVNDESAFPDITFASCAAGRQQQSRRATRAAAGGGGAASGVVPPEPSRQGGGGGGAEGGGVGGGGGYEGGWDGQGRIEEAQIVSGRGVCRKLGQGEVGYVATTHTMSGVYRKWDCQKRNPLDTTWKTTPKNKDLSADLAKRVVPGASKGQVAFQARGLDLNAPRGATGRARPDQRRHRPAGRGVGGGGGRMQEENLGVEEEWEAAASKAAKRKNKAHKHAKAPQSYVVIRKTAAAPFWLSPGVQFGRSNCRGWFPTRQDWSARGIPQCIYVPLEPSTEDRVEAMRSGHERMVGLTLEEDEERLMRIAIRESAAESRRAYEKKYGTEADREARREAQARARAKAVAERESLKRDEEKQLMEVIKASLAESLGAGEKDDRDVIAAIEASKREEAGKEGDPDIVTAIAESKRQHEAMQAMLRAYGGSMSTAATPHVRSGAEMETDTGVYSPAQAQDQFEDNNKAYMPPKQSTALEASREAKVAVQFDGQSRPLPPPPPPPPPPPLLHTQDPQFAPPRPSAAPRQRQQQQHPVTVAATSGDATMTAMMAPGERATEWACPAPPVALGQESQRGHEGGRHGQQMDDVLTSQSPPPPAVFVGHPSTHHIEMRQGAEATTALSTTAAPDTTRSDRVEGDSALHANGGLQQLQLQQLHRRQTAMMPTQFDSGHVAASFAVPPPNRPTPVDGSPSTTRQPLAPMTSTQPPRAPNYGAEPKHQRAGASSELGSPTPKASLPAPAATAAAGASAQLAGWAVRPPPSGGGAYATGGAPVETPARKTAWGAAGLASDGLTSEERELAAVLEASRLAEEARQREEVESRMAMDLALKMSMMETVAPYNAERLGHANASPRHQQTPTSAYPARPTPLSQPALVDAAGGRGYGTTRDAALEGPIVGGTRETQQQALHPDPNANYSAGEPTPHASTGPFVTSASSRHSLSAGNSGGGGPRGGAPMGYSPAGRMAAPEPQQHGQQQLPRPPFTPRNVEGPAGVDGGQEIEDEAARELRLALEEEEYYYTTSTGTSITTTSMGDPVAAAKAAKGGRTAEHLAPSIAADAKGTNPPATSVSAVSAQEGGSADLVAGDTAAAATDGGGGGGGGGDIQQQRQEEELAWVLQQSRLEAELHKSRKAMAEEGEEEMMARVLEESRREEEKRNAEQLELQRVMRASLRS